MTSLFLLNFWPFLNYSPFQRHYAKNGTDIQKRVTMNREFVHQLRYLLRIVLPSVRSKESLLLVLHTAALVIRTFLRWAYNNFISKECFKTMVYSTNKLIFCPLFSIYVAKLDGRIVQTLVNRDSKGFFYYLCFWLGVAFPATYVNSMIRVQHNNSFFGFVWGSVLFVNFKFGLIFSFLKVNWVLLFAHALFSMLMIFTFKMKHIIGMSNPYILLIVSFFFRSTTLQSWHLTKENFVLNVVRVSNLDGRLSNADQSLTEDISRFCAFLAHIHSQVHWKTN